MPVLIGDLYKYNGEVYTSITTQRNRAFKIEDLHLKCHGSNNGYVPKYVCEYNIKDGQLILRNLHVAADEYPLLNEVFPKVSPLLGGDVFEVYERINLVVPFTGSIKAGKDFMSHFYMKMKAEEALCYKTIYEFVFEEGHLKEVIDLSSQGAEERERIKAQFKGIAGSYI